MAKARCKGHNKGAQQMVNPVTAGFTLALVMVIGSVGPAFLAMHVYHRYIAKNG
jgi:hypothetical protein